VNKPKPTYLIYFHFRSWEFDLRFKDSGCLGGGIDRVIGTVNLKRVHCRLFQIV
ncbi:unnamed protein product, partial [Allacma fusca]